MENGRLMTAGSENLTIKSKRQHWIYGTVNVVAKIEKNILSVGELTQYPEIKLQFEGTGWTVYKK